MIDGFTAYRRVPLSDTPNFRDLGGYPTRDGKITRFGVFFRSACPNSLNGADIKLLRRCNITTAVDLRGGSNKDDIVATVKTIEYDPNRSANIALVCYADGEKRYILAPIGLNVGDKIVSGTTADIKVGNALPLDNIPVGTIVHNIELQPGKGGQFARAAGMSAQLMAKEGKLATLKMPSGEMRYVPVSCKATIGQVGNLDHEIVRVGKAGKTRHLGIRPTVRGSVMNPCDHPHGGGEGKSPVGRPGPQTPWGKPALGYKTRKKKNKTNKFIIKRVN